MEKITLPPKETIQRVAKKNYKGKLVIETLTNGYFIVDKNWTVLSWNKAAEKLLGLAETTMLGKNLWDKIAHLVPTEFYTAYNQSLLKEIPAQFKEYWPTMNAWFDVTTWFADNHLYFSFNSSAKPTEELDNIIDRLNTLTELYKYVSEITNVCLWEWDWSTEEIFWIDGGHKIAFGYQIENKLVPVNFWKSCIHPEDRDRVLAKLNDIINDTTDGTWEDEYRFKRIDGTYCFVHDRGHILRDENHVATRIIAATQDIDERVKMEQQMAAQKAEQHLEMTSAVLTALENERTSIGMEIHDNLSQILVVAKMYMQMAKESEVNKNAYIVKSLGFIQEVVDIIRKISKDLIIPPPNIFGMLSNIKNLISNVMEVHPIIIDFVEGDIMEELIPEHLQVNIFRIVQEQMNNILKHADASRATISLTLHNNEIQLTFTDNGKGYEKSDIKKGVGIINIKSRVELYQGTVMIHSKPGAGYELKATLLISEN